MLCYLCPVVSLLYWLGELVYNPALFAFFAFLSYTGVFPAEVSLLSLCCKIPLHLGNFGKPCIVRAPVLSGCVFC